MDAASEYCSDTSLTQSDDVGVYFVPYRWWREAGESISVIESDGKGGVLFMALPTSSYAGPMKIINNIFSSDIVFNLKRGDDYLQDNQNGDAGISGRDYALVPGEMWLQTQQL